MASAKRIMVVDDEENARYGLGLLLGQAGFDVVTVSNASEALDELKREQIKLVLSDIKMPGMDGIAFLDTIHHRFPQIDVILMSAQTGPEKYQEAIRLGAYDYIHKPLRFEELITIMERYFKTH